MLLRHRLIREEPRAAVPGRGIPLVTTDLVLRRLGVGGLSELQQQPLAASPHGQAVMASDNHWNGNVRQAAGTRA